MKRHLLAVISFSVFGACGMSVGDRNNAQQFSDIESETTKPCDSSIDVTNCFQSGYGMRYDVLTTGIAAASGGINLWDTVGIHTAVDTVVSPVVPLLLRSEFGQVSVNLNLTEGLR